MIDPTYLERIGVFVAENGEYKRYRPRLRAPVWDPSDPKAELKGMLVSYRQDNVPHPVILPLATDPQSIEEARQRAVNARPVPADFYHPRHGWLRWGRKRETEAPENRGAGAVIYQSEEIVVGASSPSTPPIRRPPEPEPVPDDGAGIEPETDTAVPPAPEPARAAGGRFAPKGRET